MFVAAEQLDRSASGVKVVGFGPRVDDAEAPTTVHERNMADSGELLK
jgi:hypothetical protein